MICSCSPPPTLLRAAPSLLASLARACLRHASPPAQSPLGNTRAGLPSEHRRLERCHHRRFHEMKGSRTWSGRSRRHGQGSRQGEDGRTWVAPSPAQQGPCTSRGTATTTNTEAARECGRFKSTRKNVAGNDKHLSGSTLDSRIPVNQARMVLKAPERKNGRIFLLIKNGFPCPMLKLCLVETVDIEVLLVNRWLNIKPDERIPEIVHFFEKYACNCKQNIYRLNPFAPTRPSLMLSFATGRSMDFNTLYFDELYR
jgi:hypothetical protein